MGRVLRVLLATASVSAAVPAHAQESRTAALARELGQLLDRAKLQVVAAREAGSPDGFVAARYTPGALLLVVRASYKAPPLLQEHIHLRRYEQAYLDLNTASTPDTKVFIEDIGANGIKARRAPGETVDVYTKGTTAPFILDGDWKKRRMKESEYLEVFSEADATYTKMLESLIAEARKTGS